MTIEQGKAIVEKYMKTVYKPGAHAVSGFKVKDGFVYSMYPNDWAEGKRVMDPFYKVNNSGKVTEYSPVMDPEEFGNGIKAAVRFKK